MKLEFAKLLMNLNLFPYMFTYYLKINNIITLQ